MYRTEPSFQDGTNSLENTLRERVKFGGREWGNGFESVKIALKLRKHAKIIWKYQRGANGRFMKLLHESVRKFVGWLTA